MANMGPSNERPSIKGCGCTPQKATQTAKSPEMLQLSAGFGLFLGTFVTLLAGFTIAFPEMDAPAMQGLLALLAVTMAYIIMVMGKQVSLYVSKPRQTHPVPESVEFANQR